MSRSSAALQQWLNFRQSLSSTSPNMLNLRANNLLTPPSRLALTTTRNGTTTLRRPFHSTQYRPAKGKRDSARPAPALRRKMRDSEAGLEPAWHSNGVGYINNKGFYMDPPSVSMTKVTAAFKEISQSMYDEACEKGLLEGISFRTFEDVALKVFNAMDGPPNPQKIRAISSGGIFDSKVMCRAALKTNLSATRRRCRLSNWIHCLRSTQVSSRMDHLRVCTGRRTPTHCPNPGQIGILDESHPAHQMDGHGQTILRRGVPTCNGPPS